jgi:peptidoglycan hydrolase-like protein with peptidoglycan-binding domain
VSADATGTTRWRDRRWVVTRVGIPAAAVIGLSAAAGLVATGGSDASAADTSTASASATVTKRNLLDRETFNGTLGYGDARSVINHAQGTVTGVAAEGAIRGRGQVLYRVDENPVVLMFGSTPAYRPMGIGDEGRDVRQLEANLLALGYDGGGMAVDEEYDSYTAEAVRDWQADLRVDETGRVELGQLVFLDGARRVGKVTATKGSAARAGQPAMETTSTKRTVSVQLDARRQDLVSVGARERVTLPDSRTVNATVTEVGTVAKASAPDADPTITVTLQLADGAKATELDEAPVDVEITKEKRENALAVPVTALLALAGGGYGVEIEGTDGNRVVGVTVGLFADGYVEISGSSVSEGTKVVVAS